MSKLKMSLYLLTLGTILYTCAGDVTYNYDNQGADWYDLGLCPDRNRQSPRKLPSCLNLLFAPLGLTAFHLEQKLINKLQPLDDHAGAFTVEPAISLTYEGRSLNSYAFHFHSKAEHVWNNVHPDLEFHWIFSDPKGGEFVVLGVGYVVGHKTDPTLKKIITIMDHYINSTPLENQPSLSLTRYAKPGTLLLHYDGSLTTPGCDEVVQWILRDGLLMVTQEDLAKIQSMILKNGQYNHRVTQDEYNNGTIYKLLAGRYSPNSAMSLFEIIDSFEQPAKGQRRRLKMKKYY